MQRFYKKQDSIVGVSYDGLSDPTKVFPEDAPLSYSHSSKVWILKGRGDETLSLRAGFYYKDDGWGDWRYISEQRFFDMYNTTPYKVDTDA